MKKRLPIGIDDFEKLIRDEYYFIDKSLIIKDLIKNESAETILLPRPRRFGKSLNMSMMKYFFTNKDSEKNRELFDNLLIEQDKEIMEMQGKYPVIHISFKDVKELTWEKCLEKSKNIIQTIFREYQYLMGDLDMFDKEDFIEIAKGKANQSLYENSLKLLSKLLYDYHGVKPIILIDEYDQPIIASHINGYFKEGINFFRNLYSGALKGNSFLKKAVLTGILRVAKESIFSGLNNLWVDSIVENNVNYFGLSEAEVEEMFEYYGMDYELEEVKEWYNGYIFGKNLVYNPWSIINFIKSDKLKPYWVNTSSNDLIRESLSNISKDDYNNLLKLIKSKPINVQLEENISLEMIENPEVIWNLMLFSGYLTLTKDKELKFPNREVRNFYINQFKSLAGYNINSFNSLMDYLLKKEFKNFKGLLQEIFYKAVSYYDVGKYEQYYHNLMLGFVFGLKDRYIIRSNREYGTGRVDLLLKSKDGELPNFIFEFKVSQKREDMEIDAKKALAQIEEKKYDVEVEDPVKIGMAFSGKEIEILIKE